jgi:hypothetical protein
VLHLSALSSDIKRSVLVRHPDDLTVPWAQRVVAQHCSASMVSNVAILSTTIGTTTRVRVAVEHNGPETLPRRWFVKFPSLAWRARLITALPRLLHTEVRFYNELAHNVPLARPAVLAAHSRFGGATLVLSDVTERGGVAGTTRDRLTPEQAASVVEKLAHFHARFWNHIDLNRSYRWLAEPIRRTEDHLGAAFAVPLMIRGLDLAGKAVPQTLHNPALHFAHYRRQMMRFLAEGPKTLVHHDCHPGNFFWNNAQPGFLDWQLVRVGEGIGDVAYFLATALQPEIRRSHEAGLLALYRQVLVNHGIGELDEERLWQRYRAHLVYPLEAMLVTLAVGNMMDLRSNLTLIRRAATAVEDLDAFAALPRMNWRWR